MDIEKHFKFMFLAWVIWILICLSLLVGVTYAAIHFLSKVW